MVGLAKNKRLLKKLGKKLEEARALHAQSGHAERAFTHFIYRTQKSWTCARRVIGKAEHLDKGANPRFIVTNLPEDYATPKALYENMYCARGDMENRIKEQQLDLFADRTSSHTMRANQLRLWFSSFAYAIVNAMRRVALKGTRMAKATCGSIRLKLFKIGAKVKISTRRFLIHFASACPYQDVFQQAWHSLHAYSLRCWAKLNNPKRAGCTHRGHWGMGRFVQQATNTGETPWNFDQNRQVTGKLAVAPDKKGNRARW